MPNLTASIPHQLTREEAKRRIKEQIGIMRNQHGSMLTDVQENWNGDSLNFAFKAMAQSISGQMTVDDQAVHLTVALPWLLSIMAGKIKNQLEQQGKLLLEAPKK